ncbi:hypothetical protein C2845_PM13G11720 [Panicum miliaceum]|uniref:DUF6598 domain-containing protein n=1 Tax=Panicum miliaceum TaxID=4540 RepID=A0A3L6RK31_PANMI|nr:hypothetical protein C2845_PM13G11720 [Panicum miliaceum]
MAAATGYGDALTEEELLAYGDLPRHGRDMAEVFAVRVRVAAAGGGKDRPPPCGTIFFHGGNSCSDLIYSRERSGTDEHAVAQPCDSEGNLVLTGPSVATSAYGPVGFDIHLHDGIHDESSLQAAAADGEDQGDNNTGRVFCDTVSGEFSTYDRAITETVATGYGPAEVVYAVLSNAVQGRVAVKLTALPAGGGADDGAATGVLGRVVARSKLLDAGCVLFYSESDGEGVPMRPGELVPLARQALVVPLHKPLTIELNLRSDSGEEIVRGAVEFNPAITGEHMERVVGRSCAEIQVTVSWSDYPW